MPRSISNSRSISPVPPKVSFRIGHRIQPAACTIGCCQERWQTVAAVHVADQPLRGLERDTAARHMESPLALTPQDLCLSRRPGEAGLCDIDNGNLPVRSRKEPRAESVTPVGSQRHIAVDNDRRGRLPEAIHKL